MCLFPSVLLPLFYSFLSRRIINIKKLVSEEREGRFEDRREG
jgi:hypothetical protein